jgi:hypothetical protein
MGRLDQFAAFVKSQAAFHEKKAKQIKADAKADPKRPNFHTLQASKFMELGQAIVEGQSDLDKYAALLQERAEIKARVPSQGSLSLMPADLEGLPPELLSELSISDLDKLAFTVISVIDGEGGVASLDRILIGLWRKTKEVHKKTVLQPKLYRMMQKKLIFPVPGKKGVYSTNPMGGDLPEPEEDDAPNAGPQ